MSNGLPPKTDSIFALAVVLANRFVIIAGGRFQDNLCPHHLAVRRFTTAGNP